MWLFRRLLAWVVGRCRRTLFVRLNAGQRRRTAWESTDAAEICAIAFRRSDKKPGLDLSPSVYALGSTRLIVQANAEHTACAKLGPQDGTNIDLAGLGPRPTSVPSSNCPFFALISAAHYEIRFASEEALLAVVARARTQLGARKTETTKQEIKDYAIGRMAGGDVEWLSFAASDRVHVDWRRVFKGMPVTPAG